MPDDRRRRSGSRGKRKAKKPQISSASPSRSPPKRRRSREERNTSGRAAAPAKDARGGGRREVAAEKPKRPEKKAVAAAAREEESDDESEDGDEEEEGTAAGGSLEERVALLEVENAALKAENAELKKKLLAVLRSSAPAKAKVKAPAARTTTPKPGQAPAAASSSSPERPLKSSKTEAASSGGGPADRRLERLAAAGAEGGSAADRRHERLAAAEVAPSDRAAIRKKYEEPAAARAPSPPGGGGADDPMKKNAVLLCNDAMEAYNESIPNNIPPESRLPLVKEKLERFMGNFGDKIQIADLKSGGAVIKDRKNFGMRYGCVFRESGAKLKGTCHKRFYFDASGSRPTFCLDFETHQSLATATPGTPQDGKLGVRDPRTEHLAVLYEEQGGKIVRMFLRPDTEKLGLDPTAGEEILIRTDIYKAFEAKIVELKGGTAGPFIFNNYHDTPTIG